MMGISKIFLLFCLIVVPIFAAVPTSVPTGQPTDQPTSQPSIPTGEPTNQPTSQPSIPTSIPSSKPSRVYDYYSPDTELDLGVKSATLRASANDVGVPLTLNITFRLTRDWYENEIILIDLPRFTRTITYTRVGRDISDDNTHDVGVLGRVHVGANVSFGGIMVSPSNRFQAAWVEGTNVLGAPYETSQLQIVPLYRTVPLIAGVLVELTILDSNLINVFCGTPSSEEYYDPTKLFYNVKVPRIHSMILAGDNAEHAIIHSNSSLIFETFYGFVNGGSLAERMDVTSTTNSTISSMLDLRSSSIITKHRGCSEFNDCSGHGYCDYCYQKCICVDGYGSDTDLMVPGRHKDLTCSRKVCPSGKAVAGIATTVASSINPAIDLTKDAHSVLHECSNMGICDTETGTCKCFEPFEGAACNKLKCPSNDPDKMCSGHGVCKNMIELALQSVVVKPEEWVNTPEQQVIRYGTTNGTLGKTTWDAEVMRGCECDSSWAVGYEDNQRQLGEYFGADCSLRRCPSGDNPLTNVNEEDCQGINQHSPQDRFLGKTGNRCHIDCSNQGICNYNTGQCKCFEGFWGENCALLKNAGASQRYIKSSNARTTFGN